MRFYNRLLQTNIRCNKGLTFISFAILEGDFVPPPCSDLGLRYRERQMSASQVLRILFLLTTSTLPAKFSQPENPSFVSAFTVLKQRNLPKGPFINDVS